MFELVLSYGPLLSYLAITLTLVLSGAGLPIPEEVIVIAAGVASSHQSLDPWPALAACLVGALVGDCVMYAIGYHFGRRVVCEHHWWTRFVKPHREARMEQMIDKHGLKVFFLARFLVGIRAPVYLSAGILRLPFRRFLLIDLFCATTVIGVFFTVSYRYGTTITRLIRGAELYFTATVVLGLLAVGGYLWHRHRRKRLRAAGELSARLAAPQAPRSAELPDSAMLESPRPREMIEELHISSPPGKGPGCV